ncbi:hypothetical protein Ocin01_00505 [Orchesella cincta]|uniref:Uncharacterized protein n=1 Tax=Orchesella cincta TaxID=48709 RepID=A0A1D2NLP2_ORCCI|nr:hypothetical protein Ocin01_00505 [Orchesella cincta]
MKVVYFMVGFIIAAVAVSSTPIRHHELPETYYEATLNVSRVKINLIGANISELTDKGINSMIANAHSAEVMIEKEGETPVLVVTLDYRACILHALGVIALLLIFFIYFLLFLMAILHILTLFLKRKSGQPFLKKNEIKGKNDKIKPSVFIVGLGPTV